MKNSVFIIFSFFMVACGGGGGGSGSNTTQITPYETACFNGSTVCDNSVYNRYQEYGWRPYPAGFKHGHDYTAYFNKTGFCGCPVGSRPVTNPAFGLGCVETETFQPFNSKAFIWSMGYTISGVADTFSPDDISSDGEDYRGGRRGEHHQIRPQHEGEAAVAVPAGNCYHDLAQSCLITQAGSCSGGTTCEPVGNGSAMGLCVRN